jgi:hypothetical protein
MVNFNSRAPFEDRERRRRRIGSGVARHKHFPRRRRPASGNPPLHGSGHDTDTRTEFTPAYGQVQRAATLRTPGNRPRRGAPDPHRFEIHDHQTGGQQDAVGADAHGANRRGPKTRAAVARVDGADGQRSGGFVVDRTSRQRAATSRSDARTSVTNITLIKPRGAPAAAAAAGSHSGE